MIRTIELERRRLHESLVECNNLLVRVPALIEDWGGSLRCTSAEELEQHIRSFADSAVLRKLDCHTARLASRIAVDCHKQPFDFALVPTSCAFGLALPRLRCMSQFEIVPRTRAWLVDVVVAAAEQHSMDPLLAVDSCIQEQTVAPSQQDPLVFADKLVVLAGLLVVMLRELRPDLLVVLKCCNV